MKNNNKKSRPTGETNGHLPTLLPPDRLGIITCMIYSWRRSLISIRKSRFAFHRIIIRGRGKGRRKNRLKSVVVVVVERLLRHSAAITDMATVPSQLFGLSTFIILEIIIIGQIFMRFPPCSVTWMGRPDSSSTVTVTSMFLLDDLPPRSKSPRSITKYKSFLPEAKNHYYLKINDNN